MDWDVINEKALYGIMVLELKVQHPDLKRLIDLMTKLSNFPSESANDFGVRVEEEMEVGG